MDSDFGKKLCAALGLEPVKPPGPIQKLFNTYMKGLDGQIIETPLPEKVHLCKENFPYWIKLENRDPSATSRWIASKISVVLPLLENGTFDETGFRFDETRANALFDIPRLLRKPNCIHLNLRNASRGDGGIRGDHMYVGYYSKKFRKVAFTITDPRLEKVILVTSFWSNVKWVEECAHTPPIHVGKDAQCTCK